MTEKAIHHLLKLNNRTSYALAQVVQNYEQPIRFLITQPTADNLHCQYWTLCDLVFCQQRDTEIVASDVHEATAGSAKSPYGYRQTDQ